MRLSTIVPAAVLAGAIAGLAFAEGEVPGGDLAAAPVADEALTPEDAQALDQIAPEAAVQPQQAPSGTAEATPEDEGAMPPAALAAGSDGAPTPEAPAAEEVPVAEPAAAGDVTWEDFEDPSFDPSVPAPAEEQPVAKLSAKAAAIPLGPMGVDAKGVEGRIHTVSRGETLWDISEAYLGTPWVWPSVWHENDGIDNPHVIQPGDKIWITSNEMRRITPEEADQMVAAVQDDEGEVEMVVDEFAFDEDLADDGLIAEEPLPAAVEDETELSVALPVDDMNAETGEVIVLPREPDANFATASTIEDAVEIADAPSIRAFLTQGDEVYLPIGEGEVQVGDEFEIFHDVIKIRDIETRAVLGYHYDELGWLRITEVGGESSKGVIQGAYSEIQRGDKIVPRHKAPQEIAVRTALDEVDGAIVFTPGIRWMRGQADSVYINVGSIHGLEVGTQLQAIDRGVVKGSSQMPDTVIAELVVIGVEPETSVAYITETDRELEVGDGIRAVMPDDQL